MSSALLERLNQARRVFVDPSLRELLGSDNVRAWRLDDVNAAVAVALREGLEGRERCDAEAWTVLERSAGFGPYDLNRLRSAVIEGAIQVCERGQLHDEELLPIVTDAGRRAELVRKRRRSDGHFSYGSEQTPDLAPWIDRLGTIVLKRAASPFQLEDLRRELGGAMDHESGTALLRIGAAWYAELTCGHAIGDPFDWICLVANLGTRGRDFSAIERVLERVGGLQQDGKLRRDQVPGLVRRLAQAWDARQLTAIDRAMTRFLRTGADEVFASLLADPE